MKNISDALAIFAEFGFQTLPLAPNQKRPAWNVDFSDPSQFSFKTDSNIGLIAGSQNGLIVLDADSEGSEIYVTRKLKELGLWDWVTRVRTPNRNGLHVYLRVDEIPDHCQAYYKMPQGVGSGEIRCKAPAYVVAPPSVVEAGEYRWEAGSPSFFIEQPVLSWSDLSWVLPQHAMFPTSDRSAFAPQPVSTAKFGINELGFEYDENPPILRLLDGIIQDDLRRVSHQTGIVFSDCFASRSEAEASLVYGLVRAGWNYDHVLRLFEEKQPGHFAEIPNQYTYLERTFEKALGWAAQKEY